MSNLGSQPKRLRAVAAAAVLLLGACASEAPEATTPTTVPACIATSAAMRTADPKPTAAVAGPATASGKPRWYVATPTGGLWISESDPAGGAASSVLPLNDRARAESQFGAAVAPGAPAFQGATADDARAVAALACAKG